MEGQNKRRVMSHDHLPKEMIEEILSRLPVKSLLRFRCVSKAWRSILGSKRFMRKQLKDSKRNTSFGHQRALLLSVPLREELFEFSECSLSSLYHKPDIHAMQFNFSTSSDADIDRLDLVGSCNGLVCVLLKWEEFVLWNPSTRISRKLPNMNINIHKSPYAYGFGCDDDYNYKVVAIFENEDYSAVYNLKSDSWKKIRNPWNFGGDFARRGKLESGKIHWTVTSSIRKGEVGERYGLEFDLKREVFEKAEKEDLASKFRILSVYFDESSHVLRTFPSMAASTFINFRYLLIYDHTSPYVSSSMYYFEIYLESLETLDTYPQQEEEEALGLGVKQ